MAYSQQLTDHFESPRNVGSLDADEPCVGSALAGSPQVGEVIRLQVRVESATGLINEARFKAYGSAAAIALCSYATQWLQGKTPEAAMGIRHADLARALDLPASRVHSAMLVAEAAQSAITNYLSKQGTTAH